MSFGDPNNPYGQQQGQPQQPGYGYPQGGQPPQPGYGYPQQGQPQQPAQPGYGYPAAPPAPAAAPGYGYPGVPASMPGLVTTARVLLFIVGGLQIIAAIVFAFVVAAAQDISSEVGAGDATSGLAGLGFILVLILVAFALWAIILGAKMGKGGNGVRITTIVYASLFLVLSLLNFGNGTASSVVSALIGLAIGGIILAAMLTKDGAAWFNRPRY
ncbi:hypothetical protein [Streptomyces sp. NPDC046887]|uniref:hypothetical protein n=1 Tax=Streptomyces sp. NPDC046887 TaxID=3155472 RepID=UPI0034030595